MSDHRTVRRGPQRALNEAAYILSSVWLALRKITLPGRIERIWQADKCCVQLRAKTMAGSDGNCFVRLPSYTFVDDDVESSLHNFMACQDALALMYTLIHYLLPIGDWVKEIVEVQLMPAEPRRFFEIYNVAGRVATDVWHCVLLIELGRGAGKFYLDLTSPQYGFYGSPLLSETSYHADRVLKGSGQIRRVFGNQRNDLTHLHTSRRENNCTFFDLSFQIYSHLSTFAHNWEELTGTNIQDVLSEGNRTESDKLIAYINQAAAERVAYVIAANRDVFELQRVQDRMRTARLHNGFGHGTAEIDKMLKNDEKETERVLAGRIRERESQLDRDKQRTLARLVELGVPKTKAAQTAARLGLRVTVPGRASTKVLMALQQRRVYWDVLRPVQAEGKWRLEKVRTSKE